MARKPAKPKSTPGSASGRKRRKPRAVTIDLEATEIGDDGPMTEEPAADPSPMQGAAGNDVAEEHETAHTDKLADVGDEPDSQSDNSAIGMVQPVFTYLKYGAAGLAGGLLALLIYSGLSMFGLTPGSDGGSEQRLAVEIAQLRENLAGQEDVRAALIGEIEAELANLASAEGTADIGNEMISMNARLDELQQRIVVITEEAGGEAGALKGQFLDLRQSTASTLAELSARFETSPQFAGLEARMASLEANTETLLTELQAAVGDGPGGIAAADLLSLRQSLASLEGAMAEMRAGLDARIEDLNGSLENANAASALLGNRMEQIETLVRNPPRPPLGMGGSGAEARAVASLAFAALERQVVAGLPFEAELALLAGAGEVVPAALVARLSAHAASGILTIDELAVRFENLAARIIDAGHEATDGGLLQSTLSRIRAVVRVRPTGFVEGDNVAAIVARTEARLGAGDLAKAVEELSALEGAAAVAAVAEWLAAARARLDGDAAISKINTHLLERATGAGTSEGQ